MQTQTSISYELKGNDASTSMWQIRSIKPGRILTIQKKKKKKEKV